MPHLASGALLVRMRLLLAALWVAIGSFGVEVAGAPIADSAVDSTTSGVASAGKETIPVANTAGLQPGMQLTISDGVHTEYHTITAVEGSGSGTVEVHSPLVNTFQINARVSAHQLNAGPTVLDPQEPWSITVLGTKFTMWNYYSLNFGYLAACGFSTVSCNMWYRALTKPEDPYVAYGPGPNTTMYYGWARVKSNLISFAPMEKSGRMQRYNELGMTIYNNIMWPETKAIALAYSYEWHDFVRPYIARVGNTDRREGQACDGSTCWNLAFLKSEFRKILAERDTIGGGFLGQDWSWMCTVILHKIFANVTLTESEAREFAKFQEPSLAPAALPENLASGKANSLMKKRIGFLERIKKSLAVKYAADSLTPTQLTILSGAILDTLLYAGGLSVPTVLDFMLGMYHTTMPGFIPAPVWRNEVNLKDTRGVYNWMYEVSRRYPPVAAVPRWITDDDGLTWQHEISNVATALNDERVFPNPRLLIMNRPGLNYDDSSLSIGWADFALDDGDVLAPKSRACPGKELSKLMIQAFFEEFNAAGEWSTDLPFLIFYNPYKVMPFYKLCKNSSFGTCTTRRICFVLVVIMLLCCCGGCGLCCHLKCCPSKKRKADDEVYETEGLLEGEE